MLFTNTIIRSSRVLFKSSEEIEDDAYLKEMEIGAVQAELDVTASHSIGKPSDSFFKARCCLPPGYLPL